MSRSGPLSSFPAEGLSHTRRYITGYEEDGLCHFVKDDYGDHHAIMVDGVAAQNIIYSTKGDQVDLNGNADIKLAADKNPGLLVEGGTVLRMIDFAPGEMEVSLDSGEKRVMRPGDVSINRAGMHKWRNCSQTEPARMLFILQDVKPVVVNGKKLEEDLGYLAKEYRY